MATERLSDYVIDEPEEHAGRQALLASLRAAVEALTACVEAVYSVIEHVDEMTGAEDHRPVPVRPQVSYGGGRSTLVPVPDRDPPPNARSVGETQSAGVSSEPLLREPQDPQPGASALMAAADMAHEGYTTDEIAERLRLRWGDRAAAILRDLMD